jgi:hypothetical protein
MLKLKKKELLKSRIEERDRVRKIAAEQRAGLRKKEVEPTEQKPRQRRGKRYVRIVTLWGTLAGFRFMTYVRPWQDFGLY